MERYLSVPEVIRQMGIGVSDVVELENALEVVHEVIRDLMRVKDNLVYTRDFARRDYVRDMLDDYTPALYWLTDRLEYMEQLEQAALNAEYRRDAL